MTRFLPRIWDDPEYGAYNKDTERLFAYHQATKHTYQSVRTNARYLDWHNQPNLFRGYEGVPAILLPPATSFPSTGTFAAIAGLSEEMNQPATNPSGSCENTQLDLAWLSRFLWHSMAVSSWKKVPGDGARYSLRVNPSSGNLHPTETYVAVRAFAGLEDGLYHYRADQHSLELRSGGGWTQHLAGSLEISWASNSPLIIGLTSIFWREAWKYRDRAYRYCCHDLGHAMMSLLLAARALGLSGAAITHFGDRAMARLIGLSGGDEAPMAFLAFHCKGASAQPSEALAGEFSGVP